MDGQAEDRIGRLENRIAELESLLSRFGASHESSAGGRIDQPIVPVLAEPPKLAAFSVVWEKDTWKMYYPSGCLLCDGQNPTGIDAGDDGMVSLSPELSTVGIRATWKKNKKTGAISELAAEISGTSTSSIIVTESGTGDNVVWEITANIPIAKIENFAVNQIANGFISISSGTGEQPKDGKLTIKYGSTEKGTFTANQSSDTEIVIPVPEIPTVNDGKLKVKFGTDAAVDEFSANQQSDSTLQFAKVASTGSYNDLSDKPTIPTQLTGTIEYIPKDGIRYDVSTQQIQVKFNTLDLSTGQHTIGTTWTMITGGQAVPIST